MGLFDFFRKWPQTSATGATTRDAPLEEGDEGSLLSQFVLRENFPFPMLAVPGATAEKTLLKLRAELAGSDQCAVILGGEESFQTLTDLWDEPSDFPGDLRRAWETLPEDWLESRRNQEAEICLDEENFAEQHIVHPEGTTPNRRLEVGFMYRSGASQEVFVALVPGPDFWTIPLHLRFGDWNACPPPFVHAMMARRWEEQYGARIATVSSDIVEFTVERVPATEAEAMELAWEQYLYCSDVVDQGVGSVATLAKMLLASNRWFFWWD